MSALQALSRRELCESTAWQPQRFSSSDVARLEQLLESGQVKSIHDTLTLQLRELVETRRPALDLTDEEAARLAEAHLGGVSALEYGTWVHYPWSGRLVHVLPELEYRELRTSRNRNKITDEEQATLLGKRVGIVGLSVGQAVAMTLAMEEVGGELLLADFDTLSLSNMNRLRTGVHNLGVNKAVITAREIFEINPYARLQVFPEGIHDGNLEQFLSALDVVVDECDDFYVKVLLREHARRLRIPVLMETSDRGLFDVERFDLEPNRALFHGLIEGREAAHFKAMNSLEKLPLAVEILGGVDVSPRLAASALEVKSTIKSWPQLASAVALGGATTTDAARRVLLGQFTTSGRFYVDLEHLVADGRGVEVKRSAIRRLVSAEALANPVLPEVKRGPDGLSSREQVRTLVSYGVMAPSGGNSQPWRFVFQRGTLRCFHEAERSKSFLDYADLASHIAFGAMTENIALVGEQQGLTTQVDLFPDSSQSSEICALRFAAHGREPRDGALFAQIPKRLTNRKPGTRARLEVEHRRALMTTAEGAGAHLTLIEDDARLKTIAAVLGAGDRLRFSSKLMNAELKNETRWTPEEVERTRDGLDVATLELTPGDLTGLRVATSLGVMDVVSKLGGGRALEQPSRRAIAGASAVGLLTFPGGTSARAMFEGGRALQRVWLTATAQGYAFQPMTALVCLFWRLLDGGPGLSASESRELKALRTAYLEVCDFPREHGEVMLFRLARADAASAHSLRRRVEDCLEFRR